MSAEEPSGSPWWASGRTPEDGLDGSEDPFGAHWDARHGTAGDDPGPQRAQDDDATATGGERGDGDPWGGDAARLAGEAIDLFSRLAAEAGRRVAARATSNAGRPSPGAFTREDPTTTTSDHPHDGDVCDACPVCMGLRAVRQVRPEVVAHLADAAHHLSLALRAVAEAQAAPDDGLEKIDLDP